MDSYDNLQIQPRIADLGGFSARRILPYAKRRMVGPFIFFDHLGPAVFAPGTGVDVRPHPHIGLATITYLFAGELVHRDSLGCTQVIRPGEVNLMTAGRGIVHSERTGLALRAQGHTLHAIQSWIALPNSAAECEPAFVHHGAAALPVLQVNGCELHLIMGSAYGATSPVQTYSPMFYLDVHMPAGAMLPLTQDYCERAVYVVSGGIQANETLVPETTMQVFPATAQVQLHAQQAARVMLLGGTALESERHIWWNFVSSSTARLEQAKQDWQAGRFGQVSGEHEFIPLPEGR